LPRLTLWVIVSIALSGRMDTEKAATGVKMQDEGCAPLREQKLNHVRQAISFMKARYFKLGFRTDSHTIARPRQTPLNRLFPLKAGFLST
jgi:hypothetical protein